MTVPAPAALFRPVAGRLASCPLAPSLLSVIRADLQQFPSAAMLEMPNVYEPFIRPYQSQLTIRLRTVNFSRW